MLFQPILDLDNKLKEDTDNFNELFKRYKKMSSVFTVAAIQPTFSLTRELLQKKILIIMLKF